MIGEVRYRKEVFWDDKNDLEAMWEKEKVPGRAYGESVQKTLRTVTRKKAGLLLV